MTGEDFKHYRLACGLTQTELGQLMGMHQQAVATIERQRGPTKQQAAFVLVLRWLYSKGLLLEYSASIGEELRMK